MFDYGIIPARTEITNARKAHVTIGVRFIFNLYSYIITPFLEKLTETLLGVEALCLTVDLFGKQPISVHIFVDLSCLQNTVFYVLIKSITVICKVHLCTVKSRNCASICQLIKAYK